MGRIFKILFIMALATGALLLAMPCEAQTPISLSVHPLQLPDSLDLQYYQKKDFPQAALTVAGLNVGVWGFDRYVRNTDFSHISLESVKENFKVGFKLDNDHLGTNMFMHPYHGNLYFNAARSNGYNFWQSSLFALGGSAMWELFMENEYPSTNDIICTPVGGMAIGEVAYRASDLVLDDRSRGSERFGREAAVFLISPMRGLTRIINGDAWRHRSTTGRQFGIPNIAVELSAGTRILAFKTHVADCGVGACTELDIEYGDRFELHSTQPYDYFDLKMLLNVQKSQPLLSQVNIMGRLISREVIENKHHEMSVGLYQHFDFYDSDTLSTRTNKTPYKLGIPASVGAGVLYRYKDHGRFTVDLYSHFNAVILGGILSDHYDVDDRNYNLASGFSIKSGANFVYNKDVLSVALSNEYYRMFTLGYPREKDIYSVDPRTLNALGDQSVAYFNVTDARLEVKLKEHLYLTGGIRHYMRSTRYRDFPDVRSSSFAYRLMLTYKF